MWGEEGRSRRRSTCSQSGMVAPDMSRNKRDAAGVARSNREFTRGSQLTVKTQGFLCVGARDFPVSPVPGERVPPDHGTDRATAASHPPGSLRLVFMVWNACTWRPVPAEASNFPPRHKGAEKVQWEATSKHGFYVLRHTFASITMEAGQPVVTPARWFGRSSPVVTLGYYVHFMSEAGSKGRIVVDGLLGRQGDDHAGRAPRSWP